MKKLIEGMHRLLKMNYNTIVRMITSAYFFVKRLFTKKSIGNPFTRPVLLSDVYPRSYRYIPDTPTDFEFAMAWHNMVGLPFENCEYVTDGNYIHVYTPSDNHNSHIVDLRHYTETPEVSGSFYYDGIGCTWDIDDNDNRYHRINKDTGLPENWVHIHNAGIIFNYLARERYVERIKPRKRLTKHSMNR